MAQTRADPAIRESPFFMNLNMTDWQRVLSVSAKETWQKGRSVSSADLGETVRFIESGHIKALRTNPETGRTITLFRFGPGDMFDVLRLLRESVGDTIFEAHGDVAVWSVSAAEVRTWLDTYPSFNRAILPYLGKLIAHLESKTADIALHDTETRLAGVILQHIRQSETNGIHLIHELSHEDLAQMIGSVRTVISRQLQHWRQAGIVESDKGKVVVKQLQGLIEKAEHHAPAQY